MSIHQIIKSDKNDLDFRMVRLEPIRPSRV